MTAIRIGFTEPTEKNQHVACCDITERCFIVASSVNRDKGAWSAEIEIV